jgi:hypothetical protein
MTSRGSDSVRSQHSCDQPDNAVVIKPMKKPEDKVDISWTYEVNFIENPNLRCARLIGCLLGITSRASGPVQLVRVMHEPVALLMPMHTTFL